MAEAFDPYEKWLGIPKDKRPLTSYRLLGVDIFEADNARITRRAERRIQLVTRQQKGKHGAIAKKVLKQLVEARDTLLDAAKKEKYDRMLRKRLGNGAPQPPPAPVQVDRDDDGSTDDLSMFNFDAGGAGGSSGGGGYGGYDPVESRKGSLNQNFWVMPVAIGTGGLVLLLIAFLLVSADPVVEVDTTTPTEEKKPEEKEKAKGFGDLLPDTPTTDPAKKDPPKKTPTTLSKEALVATWNSSKVQGDQLLQEMIRDRAMVFNEDGTYTQTTSLLDNGEEAGQRIIPGKFVLEGDELTVTPDDKSLPPSKVKAEMKLSGQLLVLNDEAQNLTITYTRAKPVDPTVAEQNPEPEVDPEGDEIVWTVNDDPPEDGVPQFVTATQAAGLKPELKVGCMGVSPDNTLVAFGGKGGKIHLYNVDGTVTATCDAQGDVLAVAVPSPQMVIAWTNQGMQVFDGQSGAKSPAEWKMPVSGRPELGMAVSAKGKYFAICRKGIRIYACEDGDIKGLIKTPADQQEVGMTFSRDGKELVVIYQKTTVPFGYRIVPHTLVTGQPDADLTKERPGWLADTAGPIALRIGDQNRKYLFVGNKYVLNADDGRVVSILIEPGHVTLPLDHGNFLVADKGGNLRVAGVAYSRFDEAVRAFGQSVGGIHICPNDPENPVSVQISAQGAGNSASQIEARLKRVMTQRLQEDGMQFEPTASKRLVITYNEAAGRKATSLNYTDANGLPQSKKYENPFTTYQANVTVAWSGENWRQPLVANSNLTTEGQLSGDPSKVFASGLLEEVAGQLSGLVNLPYFIAETPLEGVVQLPIVFNKLEAPNAGAAPAAETPEANAL